MNMCFTWHVSGARVRLYNTAVLLRRIVRGARCRWRRQPRKVANLQILVVIGGDCQATLNIYIL